jgi:hypothetical protein
LLGEKNFFFSIMDLEKEIGIYKILTPILEELGDVDVPNLKKWI